MTAPITEMAVCAYKSQMALPHAIEETVIASQSNHFHMCNQDICLAKHLPMGQ